MNEKDKNKKKKKEELEAVEVVDNSSDFRGHSEEEEPAVKPPPLWLLTFGDIMALMLTFFVLLYSMSVPDEEKWDEFSSAVTVGFSKFKSSVQFSGSLEEINIEKLDYKQALNLDYLDSLIKELIKENELLEDVDVFHQGERLILSLPEDLLFASGKADLSTAGKRAVFVIGGPLSRIRNRIEVIGHTDPTPVSQSQSSFSSNWELSLRRALEVAVLLDDVGYDRPVIVRGMASTRYDELPGNIDEKSRLDHSRRVDLIIMKDDGNQRLLLD